MIVRFTVKYIIFISLFHTNRSFIDCLQNVVHNILTLSCEQTCTLLHQYITQDFKV